MGFFRKNRHAYRPPPEPTEEDIRRAREELSRAEASLRRVEARAPEVEERSSHLDKMHKQNHIGPQFWDAIGIRRRRA